MYVTVGFYIMLCSQSVVRKVIFFCRMLQRCEIQGLPSSSTAFYRRLLDEASPSIHVEDSTKKKPVRMKIIRIFLTKFLFPENAAEPEKPKEAAEKSKEIPAKSNEAPEKPKKVSEKPKKPQGIPKEVPEKPKEAPKKPETPIKSLPTFKSINPGYTRFGFKLNLDVNPFSIPSKTQTMPKRKKPNELNRQEILPSLAGATSARKEVAKQRAMREKSFNNRRNVTRTENRTVIKGVRTNRRFELQMLMRNV